MADKNSGWSCTHGASVVSQTNSTATIRVTAYWTNNGWNYDIGGVSAWVYCAGSGQQVKSNGAGYFPSNHASYDQGSYDFTVSKGTSAKSISCYAKITASSSYVSGTKSSSASSVSISALPSYTVTYHNNGGTGKPSPQTKWYKRDLTLSSTKPTRTGYSFSKWNTNSSGTGTSYNPGATYTANAAVDLYAIWIPNTYTVKYDANGGSGAPGNQTKTYDVNLTLSSTKPTKTNYNFLGWATSPNGDVVYEAGATYKNNSAITLYAVWELAYVRPRINNFNAQRCSSDGAYSETGTYIKYTFDWATDYEVTAIWLDWSTKNDFSELSNFEVEASGTSGSVSQVVGGEIDTETSYYVRAFVSDDLDFTHSPILSIGTVKFPIDVKKGGTGVAIGKVAEEENLFDVGIQAKFREQVHVEGEIVNQHGCYRAWRGYTPDANNAITHGHYHTNTDTLNLPINVAKYGVLEVIESRGSSWDVNDGSSWIWQTFKNTDGEIYQRYGVNNTDMSSWECVKDEVVLYNNQAGSDGTITLSQSAANFKYLEIYFMDNTQEGEGYTKSYNPNGKVVDLSFIEACADKTTYFRKTGYLISGTTITPDLTVAGYVRTVNTTISNVVAKNYIMITRVIGRR